MRLLSLSCVRNATFLLIVILVFMFVSQAYGVDLSSYQQVRYVSVTSGSDTAVGGTQALPWKTLTYALSQITNASEENVYALLIASGTYTGTLPMKSYVDVYGGFNLADWTRESATEETVLDGQKTRRVVSMASNCTLDGVVITRGKESCGAGMECYQDSGIVIRNCTFIGNNASSSGGGLFCYTSSGITVDRCAFINNYARGGGGAMACYYGSNIVFSNCLIYGNTSANFRPGIWCFYTSPTIVNCTLVDNKGCGISCERNSNPNIYNCILSNQGPEITGGTPCVQYSCVQGGWPGSGNINKSPSFVNPGQSDYHLSNGSPCINAASEIVSATMDLDGTSRPLGSGVDMGAFEAPATYLQGSGMDYIPTRRYVRANAPSGGDGLTWQTAHPTIGEAIEQVNSADEIWISGGTYHEAIILEPSMSLYGGFAGTEVALSERNWAAHPVIIDATGLKANAVVAAPHVTVNGVQITHGRAIMGGGMNCTGCSPVIENCVITRNSSSLYAGGIYCEQASPIITNCIIAENTADLQAGAALYGVDCSATFNHCIVFGNTSEQGHAVKFVEDSHPEITNSIFWNRGPEIYANDIQVSYSCLQGGWDGSGNINCPPQMVDPEGGDFHLLDGSACIGRATTTIGLETDLDGNPRVQGGAPDMGAYEAPESFSQGPLEIDSSRFYINWMAAEGGDGSSWEKAFNSISDALNSVWQGDELWAAQGTYSEAVILEASVSLYGGFAGTESSLAERNWREHATTIDASGFSSQAIYGATGTVIDGFKVTGGKMSGIYCYQAATRIANCTITQNSETAFIYGGGITCQGASLEITDCTITNNTTKYVGGGIQCMDCDVKILGCSILGNSTLGAGGGVFCSHSTLAMKDCMISANKAGSKGGFSVVNGWMGGGGIYCANSTFSVTSCTLSENSTLIEGGGFGCMSSTAYVRDCIIQANSTSMGDGAGINLSSSNGVIERTSVKSNAVNTSMYHGGGLCCTAASFQIDDCTFTDNTGDGVYLDNSSVEMTRCAISSNTISGLHGLNSSAPYLSHCSITETDGIGLYLENCPAWVSNCTLTSNINPNKFNRYGGILCEGVSSATFVTCLMANNSSLQGGGMYLSNSSPTLIDCVMMNNTASEKGGAIHMYSKCSPVLRNCCLLSNTAQRGGALYLSTGSTPQLINCTLSGNIATFGGHAGGISCLGGTPLLRNCILWNDLPYEIQGISTTSNALQYCDVQGGFTGTGNIDEDPLFVDPARGDFHLQEGSPCIGKGIGPELNSLVPLFDIDGDPRSGQTCDMGADEYVGPTRVSEWMNY